MATDLGQWSDSKYKYIYVLNKRWLYIQYKTCHTSKFISKSEASTCPGLLSELDSPSLCNMRVEETKSNVGCQMMSHTLYLVLCT